MKIYQIPVKYQEPPRKPNPFMAHSIGYNIETEFPRYLAREKLLTSDPDEADWHYLPIMWSFWQLSNDYGRINRQQMQNYLDGLIIDDKRTFTISEADNEPGFEIGETVVFSGNQTVGFQGHKWVPVPIITLPHKVPVVPEKKYLSNFVGTVGPWPVRKEMYNILKDDPDIKFITNGKGEDQFVTAILESYTTLCPRGSALGSYRFYESMQLGVPPIMISDEDFRPFKEVFNWDEFSFCVKSVDELTRLLNIMRANNLVDRLTMMGRTAYTAWVRLFEKWPEYVLYELNRRS